MTPDSRATPADSQEAPELILVGGTIHTLDPSDTVADAVAVRRGIIQAVGAAETIRTLAGPGTEVLDLAGRTVLPGINDAHVHAAWLGASWPKLMFENPEKDWHGRFAADRAARKAAIKRAMRLFASMGITSFTEPGLGPGEDHGPTGCFGSDVLDLYAEIAAEGSATARVTALRLFGLLSTVRATLRRSSPALSAPFLPPIPAG
jgi:predicted amidohydrolase YtcJ